MIKNHSCTLTKTSNVYINKGTFATLSIYLQSSRQNDILFVFTFHIWYCNGSMHFI